MSALIDAGWLESFEGMEGLERVGGLSLVYFAASDLTPFSNLRHANFGYVRNGNGAGRLSLGYARNLVDLRGLEQADGITSLLIQDMPALQSLEGLLVGRRLDSLTVMQAPSLKDIDALAPLAVSDAIVLEGTGLEHLNGLSALRSSTIRSSLTRARSLASSLATSSWNGTQRYAARSTSPRA
jgi:hypothetical protein